MSEGRMRILEERAKVKGREGQGSRGQVKEKVR